MIESELDPYSEESLRNPHAQHAQLRDAGPVVWLSKYSIWAMARYEEVNSALRDHETFCSSAGVGISNFHHEEPWRPPSLLLEADPPAHTPVRSVVTRILTRQKLEVLRTSLEQKANVLIDELLEKGGNIDGVSELCELFPLQVFPDAVGLKSSDRHMLLPYADMAFNAFGPRNALLEESTKNAAPVAGWIADQCQRSALNETGFGAQIYAAADAGNITHEQAPLLVRSLLTAGMDTTIHGLGHTVHCLAANPEQWQKLRQNTELSRAALDEAVRLVSPVQTFYRTTTRAVDIGGTQIEKDQKVLLILASANRDPRRWERPDEYDIERETRGHVGFGAGIHMCVGQMLARLEAEVLLTALAKKVESIELLEAPDLRLNNTLHALARLPLRLKPV
ncbi:MAG: cytochrome P450 [Halioglobus sp.]